MRKKNNKHSLTIRLCVAALGLVALTQVAFAQGQEVIPERTSLDDDPQGLVGVPAAAEFGRGHLRRSNLTLQRDQLPGQRTSIESLSRPQFGDLA